MAQHTPKNITISGYGISPGLAIGTAFLYVDIFHRDHDRYEINEGEVQEEYERIEQAVEEVLNDLELAADRVEKDLDANLANIFRAHQTMLRSPSLREEFEGELKQELVNAEHIVQRVFHRWIRRFAGEQKPDLVSRTEDLADLSRRLLRALVGIHTHTLENVPAGSVLVARRLLPSDTVHLSRDSTVAVLVAFGGPGSHAALLTRELGIPAVAQVAEDFDTIASGDLLLVDGSSGTVVVSPDGKAKAQFKRRIDNLVSESALARERCCEDAKTPGGQTIDVLANVGCREDALLADRNGADGIGLYRIECLYLARKTPPSEDELYEEMRSALHSLQGRPVTVRLLDAGGDKEIPFLNLPRDIDPALGRRGVRLLLDYPDLLDTQLRAMLRLSREHDVRILVPLVTLAKEMEWVGERLEQAASSLGVKKRPPLGVLVETPAAALCISDIVQHADFVSVGTNDLTQYVMAAGRENPSVSDYFLDDHPAVLRLLRVIVEGIDKIPLSVCGELAGNERTLSALIDIGVTGLSVAPGRVPAVKEAVRNPRAPADAERQERALEKPLGAAR
jgi:phosphoenolpyruvate-protein phosphotransferase